MWWAGGLVGNSEEFHGCGGGTADTDLREAVRCGAAHRVRFGFGNLGEVFGVPFREQMLWDAVDAEPDRLWAWGPC